MKINMFCLRNEFITFIIPNNYFSFIIKLSSFSNKIFIKNLEEVKNNRFQINSSQKLNIIKEKNKDDKNIKNESKNENDINDNNIYNEEKIKKILNQSVSAVSQQLKYLSLIMQLQSIVLEDLNNINQIEKIIINQNNNFSFALNCFLIESENFDKIKEKLYFEDCKIICYLEDIKEKDSKINELFETIKKENKQFDNAIMQIINDYNQCCKKMNDNNNAQFMFVNEDFLEEIELDKNLYEKSNICIFKVKNELFLYFKDKRKIMKVFISNNYFSLSENIKDIN